MNITQFRQEVIRELEAVGISVHAGGIRKEDPPYVQLYPAENFIERIDSSISATQFNVTVTYNLSVIAGPEDKDTSFDHLDSLTAKCLWAVKELDNVTVSSFVAVDSNNSRILAANITFSCDLNITEGEL